MDQEDNIRDFLTELQDSSACDVDALISDYYPSSDEESSDESSDEHTNSSVRKYNLVDIRPLHPFLDPGSQTYEAFDYQEPQDNGSSEGKAALELGLLPAQLLPPAQLGPGGAGVRHQRRCLAKPSFPDAIITVALMAANNKRHQDLCQVKHFFDIDIHASMRSIFQLRADPRSIIFGALLQPAWRDHHRLQVHAHRYPSNVDQLHNLRRAPGI